ncbi:MAG: DUF2975 domain-containing protein [Clostridia bacterium]|nr:DUF2975 domain-containing protein [Clostridia bacterium]
MKYTSLSSAKLTLAITYFFCGLLIFLLVFAKPLVDWFFGLNRPEHSLTVLVSFYICSASAVLALLNIIKLLKNIIKGEIFSEKNVSSLRILSWCCMFVSFVCFVSGFFYVPMWIFSLGAAFMMLILRVLKNVMAKATEIKNENELTI